MSFNERTQRALHENTTSVLEIPGSQTHSPGIWSRSYFHIKLWLSLLTANSVLYLRVPFIQLALRQGIGYQEHTHKCHAWNIWQV